MPMPTVSLVVSDQVFQVCVVLLSAMNCSFRPSLLAVHPPCSYFTVRDRPRRSGSTGIPGAPGRGALRKRCGGLPQASGFDGSHAVAAVPLAYRNGAAGCAQYTFRQSHIGLRVVASPRRSPSSTSMRRPLVAP